MNNQNSIFDITFQKNNASSVICYRSKPATFGAPQGGHGAAAAQSRADIVTNGAHIGALGAQDAQEIFSFSRLLQKLQLVDGDGAALALHLLSLPGQLVEFFAADLNGGEHGWDLLNVAGEPGQYRT